MVLLGQGWTDSDPSAWLALTFIEVPLGPGGISLQIPSYVLVSSPCRVFGNGPGAFQLVISISTARSMYGIRKFDEEAFLQEKN